MKFELRHYQRSAVDATLDAWDRGVQRPALVLPCGGGKTIIFSEIASNAVRVQRRRPLILVHRDDLVRQAVDKLLATDPGLVVGVIKAERHEVRADVCVASVQTLTRRLGTGKRGVAADRFDTIITDECFPAGTLVGNREIQDLRPGDLVPSYDETTGHPVLRRVVRTMSRKPSGLVCIHLADGERVVCTPEHPFLTDLGWLRAAQLSGASVLSLSHDASEKHSESQTENLCGREFARIEGATGAGRSAGRQAVGRRVAYVQVLESGGDGTHGGVCPGGLVYNIEVEETHTYRVGSGLVVHNCHHAVSQSYVNIYKHFGGLDPSSGTRMLGVSATLSRSDGVPLGAIWDEVVYEYSIADAMHEKFLVPATAQRAVLADLDLSKVKTLAGDWSTEQLDKQMFRSGLAIGEAILQYGRDGSGRVRRGVVFAPTVHCAQTWAEDFSSMGIRSLVVTGNTPIEDRLRAYKLTDVHENDLLVSVGVLVEGFDLPSVELCVMGRPTKSKELYTQAVGRVLRLSPETGKTSALVLDVCGTFNDKLRTLVDLALPKACDCACDCDFEYACPKVCRCPRSKKGKLKRPCVLCARLWITQPKVDREPCMHYVGGHVVGCKHRCDGPGSPGPHEEDETEEILDPEAPEPKEVTWDDSDVLLREVDLFDLNDVPGPRKAAEPKKRPKAWRLTYNGRPYLPSTTTFNYWIFLHKDADGTWSTGELSKEKRSKAERIATGLTFADAVAMAEDNHPTGGWLGRPLAGLPSEGQLATLKNWGVEIPQGCTKQQASDLLSDLFASRALG